MKIFENLISIVIPTYEMNGMGDKFLKITFDLLKNQSSNLFEVIVSDHSKDNNIEDLCKLYDGVLPISYYRNEKKRGNSSSNLNYGITKSNGNIIKPLMQDEHITDNDFVYKLNSYYSKNINIKWCLFGSVNGKYPLQTIKEPLIPTYDLQKLIKSINTIGSPSVCSFIKDSEIEFNEELIWVMDCDFYIRCKNKMGDPGVIEDAMIFINEHPDQLTNTLTLERKQKEEDYLINKYK
jgi:glycosyltransferase involved in cell wall biosynthesis